MLTRRTLLGGLGLAVALPRGTLAGRRPASEDRVLVVVQLTGGNDGLATVVPWRQDGLARARPTLAQRPDRLHRLDDDHGLHPAMGALGPLFAEGRLTIVQGVGFAGAGRSHFHSLEVWHTGQVTRPGQHAAPLGWLGRMADQQLQADPASIPALHVGPEAPSPALAGVRTAPTGLETLSELQLRAPGGVPLEALVPASRAEESPDEAHARSVARSAHQALARLSGISTPENRGSYPDEALARGLRLVATLIERGPGTRLFSLSLGGFDTHARQAPTQAALLARLSDALAAFERDLSARGLSGRVATLVFSEFGRRVEENGSRGTDHGAAAPVLLFGGPGRGGLIGSPPDLDHLEDGDLPVRVDFRSLYSALEHDWMGLQPSSGVAPLRFDS
jgi:uncharacterized protein (DUF1501 family)